MPLLNYPITLPASPGFVSNVIRPISVVAKTISPFSLAAQVQVWSGQQWETELSLPPMNRVNGEIWAAAFASLNGLEGSFLIGDTANKVPRGVGTGTPLVNGASQTGYDLVTDGWTGYQTGILKAGDWLQLGQGNTSRLYKVSRDVNTGTNLLLYSNVYSNAAWTKNAATIVASLVNNPWDGGLNVDALYETVANANHYALQALTQTLVQHTISFDVKPNGRSWFAIQVNDFSSGAHYQTFNITTGVLGASNLSCTATITAVADGFYRCSITYTPANAGVGTVFAFVSNVDGFSTYVGDVTKGIFIAQGQAERASTVGPRIFTTAAQITDTTAATITVWPALRSSPADNAVITVSNPRGRFSLLKPVEWTIGRDHIYRFGAISAAEDLRP